MALNTNWTTGTVNRTFDFVGVVGRHNEKEGLVIFRGGGAFPYNWDLQVSANLNSYPINSRVHIHFVLTDLRKFPFAGWSFRGENVTKVH